MTAEELIAEATNQIKSQSGYSYDPTMVDDICHAGYDGLADGTVLSRDGDNTVSIDKTRDVLAVVENGNETKTIPLTPELKDKAVMVTAIKRSRKGYQVGTIL